jgi:nuclear pore complex protein Nup98-Nup96
LPQPSPADKSTTGSIENATSNGEASSSEPSKLKKRVSFDKEITGGQDGTLNGETGALVRTENDTDDTPNRNATSEAESHRGNELAVVPEDRASDHVSPKKNLVEAKADPQPGDYWMKPSRAELSKLPREKLQKFTGFQVGRKGCGYVVFNEPVDLTTVPLDDLYEKIVEIRLRAITVYPDASSKPPVGKGLNVPSTISIENSWPRARGQPSSVTSGPAFEKHVNRLKKMQSTEFLNYDVATGVWTFKVPHYTRYGLDYDDEDDVTQSQLPGPPDCIDDKEAGHASSMAVDDGEQEYEDEGDDTFAFKQKTVPGGFGKRSAIFDDADSTRAQALEDGPDSDAEVDSEDDIPNNDVDMAGSFPGPGEMQSPVRPILKASRLGTPSKALITLEGDWAEQLQRTISPRKQNRDALRDVQSKFSLDHVYEPMKPNNINKKDFRTSIDIMNSLFNRHEQRMAKGRKEQAGPDFEV